MPGPRGCDRFDREAVGVPAGLLCDESAFSFADVLRQIGDEGRDLPLADFAALHDLQTPKLLNRLNAHAKSSAAGRIEAGANQNRIDRNLRPHPIDQRKMGFCQKIQRLETTWRNSTRQKESIDTGAIFVYKAHEG